MFVAKFFQLHHRLVRFSLNVEKKYNGINLLLKSLAQTKELGKKLFKIFLLELGAGVHT